MAVDPVVQDFIARSMAENNRSLMSEMSALITNTVESIKRSNSEAVEDRLREIKKMRRFNAVRLLHLDAIGSRFIHVRSRIFPQKPEGCFACGKFGHWRAQCSLVRTSTASKSRSDS